MPVVHYLKEISRKGFVTMCGVKTGTHTPSLINICISNDLADVTCVSCQKIIIVKVKMWKRWHIFERPIGR